jgi:hypothetical protein
VVEGPSTNEVIITLIENNGASLRRFEIGDMASLPIIEAMVCHIIDSRLFFFSLFRFICMLLCKKARHCVALESLKLSSDNTSPAELPREWIHHRDMTKEIWVKETKKLRSRWNHAIYDLVKRNSQLKHLSFGGNDWLTSSAMPKVLQRVAAG